MERPSRERGSVTRVAGALKERGLEASGTVSAAIHRGLILPRSDAAVRCGRNAGAIATVTCSSSFSIAAVLGTTPNKMNAHPRTTTT